MRRHGFNPVVHLELHTADRARAGDFYAELLDWPCEQVETGARPYVALALGGLSGGIVECGTTRSLWLPYVEVGSVDEVTARARRLGASVLLEPREGPAGRRSVVRSREAGEIAFWEPRSPA